MFVSVPDVLNACPRETRARGRPVMPMIMAFASPAYPFTDMDDPAAYMCAFARSWATHSPHTRVVVFTDSQQLYDHYMLNPRRPPNLRLLMVPEPAPVYTDGWVTWRWWYYLRFTEACLAHVGKLGPIMSGDARDGVILSNPWRHPAIASAIKKDAVLFSLEGGPQADGRPSDNLLKDSVWNGANAHGCFEDTLSPKVFDLMMSGPVTCAGYTVGSGPAMLKYFQTWVDVMQHNASAACWWLKARNGGSGDQAVHIMMLNVLNRLPGPGPTGTQLNFTAVALSNGMGPIYSSVYGRPIHFNALGEVTVRRGPYVYRPTVLHQYDRDPELFAAIQKLYNCLPGRAAPLSRYDTGWQ